MSLRRNVIAVLLAGLSVVGCAEQDVPKRRYQEVVVEAPPPMAGQSMGGDPHAMMPDIPMPAAGAPDRPAGTPSVEWDTPKGWREEPGAGMRMATLRVDTEWGQGECSIIALAGQSGTLQANVVRWMGQVKITPPSGAAMQTYLDELDTFTTAGGSTGVLIDFAPFVDQPDAPSTLAAIIDRGPETLFIKMTGSKALLAQERERFEALCRSIR